MTTPSHVLNALEFCSATSVLPSSSPYRPGFLDRYAPHCLHHSMTAITVGSRSADILCNVLCRFRLQRGLDQLGNRHYKSRFHHPGQLPAQDGYRGLLARPLPSTATTATLPMVTASNLAPPLHPTERAATARWCQARHQTHRLLGVCTVIFVHSMCKCKSKKQCW